MINALAASFFESYGMIIILVVFFVLMIVLTIIPQRKQKKQQETMMNSLGPGAKVMTIGGFVGTIVGVDQQNFMIDVGTPGNPQVVTIVKSAIRQRLDVAPVATAPVTAAAETTEEVKDTTVTDAKVEAENATSFVESEKAAEAVVVDDAKAEVKSRKKVTRK